MEKIIDIRDLMAHKEEQTMARRKSENPKVEFMRKYLEAERRIPMKMEQVARLRQRMLPGAQEMSGMPSGGKAVTMCDSIAQILLMIERIEQDIARMREYHEAVLKAIDALPEMDMRTLMEARYVNGWNWDKIARVIHCDPSTAWRLHKRTLRLIEMPEGWQEKNRCAG